MTTLPAGSGTPTKQVRVKPKRRQRRCAQCRGIFVWRRPERIYCSTYCRVKAWQTKRREAALRQPSPSAPGPSAATSLPS